MNAVEKVAEVLTEHRLVKALGRCACGLEVGDQGHRTQAHRVHVAAALLASGVVVPADHADDLAAKLTAAEERLERIEALADEAESLPIPRPQGMTPAGWVARRRVAVVVFCEVDAELQEDAEAVAALAVRRHLTHTGAPNEWPADISTDAYGHHFAVRALRAMEAGIAIGNGYLWTAPTAKAYREGGSR